MARSKGTALVALLALLALLAAVAAQGAAAATTADITLPKTAGTPQAPERSLLGSGGGFTHCLLNGGRFPHHGWFDRLQCCNGVWTHGGCSGSRTGSAAVTGAPDASSQQQQQPGGGASAPAPTTAASAGSNRKLLSDNSASFRFCEINGRRFGHFLWFSGLQCCDGSWSHGGCGGSNFSYGSTGHCQWEGSWYPGFGWYNGFQCCSGSWRHGGCS